MTSERKGSTPFKPRFERALAFVRAALLTGLLFSVLPAAARGQSSPGRADRDLRDLPDPGTPVARFEDAVDGALDPRGGLLVLDRGTGTLVRIRPSGRTRALLAVGAAGEPAEPVAFDPTNGLTVLVADAARGTVGWYTRSGRLLERRAVETRSEVGDPVGRWDRADPGGRGEGDGRPAAVAAEGTGWTYVLESVTGAIVVWDERGEEVRRLPPDVSEGEGVGVDLLLAGGRLHVLDRDGTIRSYDRTGRLVRSRSLPLETLGTPRALSSDGADLLVTGTRGLVVVGAEGGRRLLGWSGVGRPVDAHLRSGELHVLTAGALYRLRLPDPRDGDRTD